jgi:hypothetical protein
VVGHCAEPYLSAPQCRRILSVAVTFKLDGAPPVVQEQTRSRSPPLGLGLELATWVLECGRESAASRRPRGASRTRAARERLEVLCFALKLPG